jgi:WD40 repeat protein
MDRVWSGWTRRRSGKSFVYAMTQSLILSRFSPNIRIDTSLAAPKDVAADGGVVAVADTRGMTVLKDGKTVKAATASDGFSAVAVHGDLVAYGGSVSRSGRQTMCTSNSGTASQDKKVYLDSLSSDGKGSVFDDNRGEVISIAFSPNGKLLAAGDVSTHIAYKAHKLISSHQSSGRIVLIDAEEKKVRRY